jgi:hypothetical protein
MADREGAFGWTAPSEELFRFHLAQVRERGGYLLGSRLYETMLGMPAVAPEFVACSRVGSWARNGYVSSGTAGHARPRRWSRKQPDFRRHRARTCPRVPACPSLVVLS